MTGQEHRQSAPFLVRAGLWLRDRQSSIRRMQWGIVIFYTILLIVPVMAPVPTRLSHIWSDAVLFAQFIFWGLWWPGVLVSVVLLGRAWCGLFCPEGMLCETASHYGRGRSTPAWVKWKAWPLVAFSCTTIYGQMVSVYQYPKPALLILGGSTVAAIVVGLLYGRGKRIWCRYLCPVSGVFTLLTKLSPFHFKLDKQRWDMWRHKVDGPTFQVNCAPLVPIKTMQGAAHCHMCGRCAGFKQAIDLELRSPSDAIVTAVEPKPWESAMILFGLIGIATGAFQWSSSAFYGAIRQEIAEWLVERGGMAFLQPQLPWWILTNYPDQNDMMTPLDGAVTVGYILIEAVSMALSVGGAIWLATRALGPWQSGPLAPSCPMFDSLCRVRRFSWSFSHQRHASAP